MSKQLETDFISRTALDLGIGKRQGSSDADWKCRTIYSMAGRIGLCSLWDKLEEETVSVVHFRRAIEKEITYLLRVYGECKSMFPEDVDVLSEEFLGIYTKCGYIYRSPFKIHPAIHKYARVGNIEFLRGVYSDLPCKMSGLGLYRVIGAKSNKNDNVLDALELFHISKMSIMEYGKNIISEAEWKEFSYSGRVEHLNTKGFYKSGYWSQEPEKDGGVSLLRVGERGQQIYYLYYYDDNKCYSSMLQPWCVENGEYRKIALYIISQRQKLIHIEYRVNGTVVEIKQNYLLPPDELNFIKLYSWPSLIKSVPSDFNRIMNKEVFISVKTILENVGYILKGV